MLNDSLWSKTYCIVDCYNIMMLLPFTMQAKEVQIEGQNNYFTGSIDIIKLNGGKSVSLYFIE